ncbi:hypothetical protein CDAR_588381 [Caerostris darwini]|uniref:Uncharacterized protein n=1 Tax=Caerostris darwini TaxID=1538125 RepID=A0AAV4SD03_9ARAC|nr:hypothetical protein CDAR_588381 [Caerostris darwini]
MLARKEKFLARKKKTYMKFKRNMITDWMNLYWLLSFCRSSIVENQCCEPIKEGIQCCIYLPIDDTR